jgi:hypothetical protein
MRQNKDLSILCPSQNNELEISVAQMYYINDVANVANLSFNKDFISACELFILTNVDLKYDYQKFVAVDVSL